MSGINIDQPKALKIDAKSEMEQMLREQNRLLQEQIDYLTKKLFAPSSEKHSAEIPGQLHLKYVL